MIKLVCLGRGRVLHTDLDPATLEEVSLDVDLCSVNQLKVPNRFHDIDIVPFHPPQVSYTMAGRRGGRTKLVRRLQVAARYPGIWGFSGYPGTWYLGL